MNLALTYQMIEDYRPYLKDPDAMARFWLREAQERGIVIDRIEEVPFTDRDGIKAKLYYCKGTPLYELNVANTGRDSL